MKFLSAELGVVTAATSLIHALAEANPEQLKPSVGFAGNRLSRIVTSTYQDLQVILFLHFKIKIMYKNK